VAVQDRPLKGAWGITSLIFLFMLVNFADKMVVGLAAKPIMDDLKLTPEQFGLIGSAFFFLFPFSAILVGFVVNRLPARNALLAMAIFWSLLQFPMLGLVSFEFLLACRILLGAAEGPASPVATHALYKWFPDSLRAVPTAVVAQGSAIGVVVAVPVLNWIIVHHSWHWAFGAIGIAGLVWSILWFFFGREGMLVDPPMTESVDGDTQVPYRDLLTCPTIVAACCTGFASYWGLALGLTWFTPYLVDGLGFSQTLGGNLSVLPWIAGLVVVLAGSWLSQRLKAGGASSRVSRGILASAAVMAGGCILPFIGFTSAPDLKLAILIAGTAIGSTIFVVVPLVVSELTPQSQRAAMLAIVNSIMTLGGVIAPFAMGVVVQDAPTRLAGYDNGFTLLGGLLLASGLIGLLFIRPEADRQRLAGRAALRRTSGIP
jgi:ACS family D-galactonate transporter-like MFS transporter